MITDLSQLDFSKDVVLPDIVVICDRDKLDIHTLIEGKYVPGKLLVRSEQAQSSVLTDLVLDLSEVFESFDLG